MNAHRAGLGAGSYENLVTKVDDLDLDTSSPRKIWEYRRRLVAIVVNPTAPNAMDDFRELFAGIIDSQLRRKVFATPFFFFPWTAGTFAHATLQRFASPLHICAGKASAIGLIAGLSRSLEVDAASIDFYLKLITAEDKKICPVVLQRQLGGYFDEGRHKDFEARAKAFGSAVLGLSSLQFFKLFEAFASEYVPVEEDTTEA